MQGGSSFLARSFYGNSVVEWAAALVVAAGSMILIWAVGRLMLRRLTALAGRTTTDVDDLVAELLAKTKFLFVLLVGIWAGSRTLSLSPTVTGWITEILVVGLLLQGAFWATGVVNYLLDKYRSSDVEIDPDAATAMGAVGFVARVAIWRCTGASRTPGSTSPSRPEPFTWSNPMIDQEPSDG